MIGDSEYEDWSVPSFELSLNIIKTNFGADEFKSKTIDEIEFNK